MSYSYSQTHKKLQLDGKVLTSALMVELVGNALRTVDAAEFSPGIRTVPKSHGRSSSFVLNVLNL